MQLRAASRSPPPPPPPLLLLVVVAWTAASAASSLEKDSQCKLEDGPCLKKYFQNEIVRRFSKGFPEFGVRPLDPLQYDDLVFNYAPVPGIKVVLSHIKPVMYGLAKTQVLGVRNKRRKVWVHDNNTRRKQEGEFHTLYQQLREHEERFYIYFRMLIECFDEILALIEGDIQKEYTNYRKPVEPAERLAVTLRSRISGSSFSLEASVSIPKLLYEGSYTLKGLRLLRPVDWSGKFNMSLGNVTDTWKLIADVVKKGKDNYLDLQDLAFSPEVSTFSTYATGLFGELKEAGQITLLIMNKHWKLFFDEIWTLAEPQAVKTASRAVRRVLFQTPVDAPSSA